MHLSGNLPPFLNRSRAPVANRNFAFIHNYRNCTISPGILQHFLKSCFVSFNIEVLEGCLFSGEISDGAFRIGSPLFSEDHHIDFFYHHCLPLRFKNYTADPLQKYPVNSLVRLRFDCLSIHSANRLLIQPSRFSENLQFG